MNSSVAQSPGWRDYLLLIFLSALWGASFMLIKVAVQTIPALPMTTLRLIVAAIVMVIVALASGEKLPVGFSVWSKIAFVAVLGNAVPFGLISWGEESVDSGLAAIMMAIMPLTTLLLAHIFTADEKLNRWKFSGVLFGLVGLIVLLGPEKLLSLGDDVVRQLAIALAAIFYGMAALVVKFIRDVPVRSLTAAILVLSALSILPVTLASVDISSLSPSPSSLIATITLGIFQTALAGLLAYFMIRKLGATFFSQLNFMVPLFGVFFGIVFLAETVGFYALLALVIILTGIGLSRYGIDRSGK